MVAVAVVIVVVVVSTVDNVDDIIIDDEFDEDDDDDDDGNIALLLLVVYCDGVLRLFVTGDWPDGEREPKYLRTDFVGGTILPLKSSVGGNWIVVVAATRCGSAVCEPKFDRYS